MVLFLKHILLCRSLLSFFHQGEVHVAAVDIDLGTLYPNSVAQAIALAALFFLECDAVVVDPVAFRQGGDVYQTLYRVGQGDIETEVGDAGNDAVEDLAQVLLHIFSLVAVVAVTLDGDGTDFGVAGLLCRLDNECAETLLDRRSVRVLAVAAENAVDRQIGIAAER